MQKNKLVNLRNLDFIARLTTALAPADETVLRHAREAEKTPPRASAKRAEANFTAQYLGSI